MKRYLTYTVAALIATTLAATAAPNTAAMEAKENSAWQAFKDKDPAAFEKVVDHDMIGIYSDGIADMAKEMSDMKKWDMKSFKISDFKSHSDEKDVCVTSYIVTLEGTFDGKDASGVYNAGSVWKMENGKWLAIFHSNVKQEAAAPAGAQKKE